MTNDISNTALEIAWKITERSLNETGHKFSSPDEAVENIIEILEDVYDNLLTSLDKFGLTDSE